MQESRVCFYLAAMRSQYVLVKSRHMTRWMDGFIHTGSFQATTSIPVHVHCTYTVMLQGIRVYLPYTTSSDLSLNRANRPYFMTPSVDSLSSLFKQYGLFDAQAQDINGDLDRA